MEPGKRTRAASVPAVALPESAVPALRRRGTEQPHRRMQSPAGRAATAAVPTALPMPDPARPANGREGTGRRARRQAAPEPGATTATAANQEEASRTRSGAVRASIISQEVVAIKSASRAGLAQVPVDSQAVSPKHTAVHEALAAASCQRREGALPCAEGGRLLHILLLQCLICAIWRMREQADTLTALALLCCVCSALTYAYLGLQVAAGQHLCMHHAQTYLNQSAGAAPQGGERSIQHVLHKKPVCRVLGSLC